MSCDPWPLVWPCTDPPVDSTPEQQTVAVAIATDMLWALTGRRFGTCTVTEQYVTAPQSGSCGLPPSVPGPDVFRPMTQRVIHLAQLPVESIIEVQVDGVVLDPAGYTLGRGGALHRVGGQWPATVDPSVARVQVTYVWGVRLVAAIDTDPEPQFAYSAGIAVGELAVDLLSGMCGGACKLPSRLASLSRQGVSLDFLPPGDFIEAGLTGLPLADAFIRTVNPHRLRMRSRVFTPDMAHRL